MLAAGMVGCAVVSEEEGVSVTVAVAGAAAPVELTEAWLSARSVELLPCPVAFHATDLLLGRPAAADHSVDSLAAVALDAPLDLLASRELSLTPPVGDYCFARLVLEPLSDTGRGAATVGRRVGDAPLSSTRVVWVDLPLGDGLALSARAHTATVVVTADLSRWVAPTTADGLFLSAQDSLTAAVLR